MPLMAAGEIAAPGAAEESTGNSKLAVLLAMAMFVLVWIRR